MSKLIEVRNRVRLKADQRQDYLVNDEQLNEIIRLARDYVFKQLVDVYQDYFNRVIQLDLIFEQPVYDLPEDFHKLRCVLYYPSGIAGPQQSPIVLKSYDLQETGRLRPGQIFNPIVGGIPYYRVLGRALDDLIAIDNDVTIDPNTPGSGLATVTAGAVLSPVVITGTLGPTLQQAYTAGNIITTTTLRPVTINGPIGEKLLVINGDVNVTGVIDPEGILLTPLATGALPTGTEGMFASDATLNRPVWHDGSQYQPIQIGAGPSLTLPDSQIYVGNGANVATAVPVTGAVAITNTGTTSLTNGSVGNATIVASAAIDLDKLAPLSGDTVPVTDLSGFLTDSTISGTELSYLSGASSNLQTQINALLSSGLLDGYMFVGDVTNMAQQVVIGGDATISNAGDLQIASQAIVDADINNSAAIALSKLAALPTHNSVLVSDNTGVITESGTSTTVLGYLDVGSSLTSLLSGKQTTALATGYILVGNGSNIAAAVDPNSTVISQLLTGYSSTTGTVSSSDSIVGAIGKLNGNFEAATVRVLNETVGAVAATGNSPTTLYTYSVPGGTLTTGKSLSFQMNGYWEHDNAPLNLTLTVVFGGTIVTYNITTFAGTVAAGASMFTLDVTVAQDTGSFQQVFSRLSGQDNAAGGDTDVVIDKQYYNVGTANPASANTFSVSAVWSGTDVSEIVTKQHAILKVQ